jgi:predicted transcriptional regulator|tara:strand:+ start:36 stop:224 length:189 start_codon:yes stop_codon:yes gene_type:complete
MKTKVKVHRGRVKAGKVQIQIHLTSEELERLDKLAEAECRSRTMQATWMILKGISNYDNLEI